jgi:uncharacterized membrane protein YvlD (DUF360 family)
LAPSKVIAGVVARFKRKKVSTPIETSVPSSIMEALVMAFPLLQLLTLPILGLFLRALNLRMFLLTSLLVELLSISYPD